MLPVELQRRVAHVLGLLADDADETVCFELHEGVEGVFIGDHVPQLAVVGLYLLAMGGICHVFGADVLVTGDIDSGKYFNSQWYYDNALMPKALKGITASSDLYNPEFRKSYLPVPLFLTVDFWINLPVITDMDGLGVCAALGNASIWNMSNNERFLKQPANASMASARRSRRRISRRC